MSSKSTCLPLSLCLAILLIIGSLAVSVIVLVYVVDLRDEGCKIKGSTETHINGGANNGAPNDHHHDHDHSDVDDDVDLDKCHDIAIVGAGPGGTYTAYKMRNQNLDIAIYEQLHRVGGKLLTVDIPGVEAKADLGAIRYKSSHARFIKYIEELGIETKRASSSGVNDRVYHLRGHNFRQPELVTKPLPYDLRDNEKAKYFSGLIADANQKIFGTKHSDPHKTNTTRGVPLWKLGYTNELSKVLSSEAIRYILDTAYWDDDIYANLNADFHWFSGITSDWADSQSPHLTIVDGFQTFAEKLSEAFLAASDKHSLHLNHQVRSLELASTPGSDKIYKMKVKDMSSTSEDLETICAKKVILALPTPALKRIDWDNKIKGQYYVDNVDSVVPIQAFKMILAYDRPWWRTDGHGAVFDGVDDMKWVITDLPIRQVIDMEAYPERLNNTGKSLLLIYSADVAANSFRDLTLRELTPSKVEVKSDPGQYSNQQTVDLINSYFSRIFNISEADLPQPYAVVSQHWGDDLHGAAWHFWRPGYKWADVMENIVKPTEEQEIYICGEAYSANYQTWPEGALEVCDVMLSKHFGL